MLESAVSYCQQAGLQIAGENADEKNADQAGLVLFIPGAHYVLTDNGTRAAFRLDAARVSAQDAGADVSAQGETAPRIGTCQADVSAQDAPNIGAGVSAHAGAAQATP
jgi:sarcosine oxidase gamma subunit